MFDFVIKSSLPLSLALKCISPQLLHVLEPQNCQVVVELKHVRVFHTDQVQEGLFLQREDDYLSFGPYLWVRVFGTMLVGSLSEAIAACFVGDTAGQI